MEQYWIWLSLLKLPNRLKICLLQEFSDPETLYRRNWCEEETELATQYREILDEKDLTAARRIVSACKAKDVELLPFTDLRYPPRLRSVEDAPVVLYCRGVVPQWESAPLIAVVGTRNLSSYGEKTALRMGRQIAACGGIVVSGGALGVDALAMDAALSQEKCVVGVLGCGVDVAYPKVNTQLFEKVVQSGCLLSEYPPGTRPNPWHFPRRNRIVSGISNAVLVVEAPEESGALITASLAREQGRDIYAVPGNVGAATCTGSNALLQQGATAAMCGWDVMRDYASLYPSVEQAPGSTDLLEENQALFVAQTPKMPTAEPEENLPIRKKSIDKEEKSSYSVCVGNLNLSEEERQITDLLTGQAQAVDQVLARLDMPYGKALSVLTKLTLMGVVKSHPGNGISLK